MEVIVNLDEFELVFLSKREESTDGAKGFVFGARMRKTRASMNENS